MEYLLNLFNGNWVDEITRLPNKDFFENIYPLLKKSNTTFYLIYLDLKFESEEQSEINFVIARIASIIKHSVRIPKDFICRSSEKGFVIILHGVNEIIAKQISSRIKESLDYLLLNYGNKNIKIETDIKIEALGGAPSE
ncbi:diguanylate cyclase [Thermosipho melanesiensis]|uniref:Diguanylate cyclase n=2 Tax=Thermosipho melanesiensis TaxID=46541 RepID=A0ABN4UWE7_9BACT|nr:diguanylate cyclase [Thermosipho melanesiensis]ABR31414.1 putative diguanylate cyclase [Thermosipho melanesiensis BI429]APT74473.1 diguanylate cyclase [Thermosipho melanesiensis]OOC36433.1 diguanylate cyclase [Thermosipho melanesiensis]OOC37251.1 diguanylate cyclase [Thermosipho melanesiensis]OOC38003.1 diguanylate cyclase [Thermosipho melanesiensis]